MRLLHPMMPFITEEIWQALRPVGNQQGETIMLQRHPGRTELPPSASAIVERRTISSPLAGLIDNPAAELARLQKRKAKALQDVRREEAKLSNQSFIANAPAELVAEVRGRIAEAQRQIEQIEEQERQVRSLQ